jgi:hypothetical protein
MTKDMMDVVKDVMKEELVRGGMNDFSGCNSLLKSWLFENSL